MKLTESEKIDFAIKLKAKVTSLYAEEVQSSKNELSYLGVCRMTDRIEEEFIEKTGDLPKLIKGACHLARALRNPDKMKTQEDLRKAFALLVGTAGGFSIIWGVLTMVNIGTVLLVLIFGAHIPIFGPVAICGGLAAILGGVYVAISKQTPPALSAKAHDLLIEAISNWANEKAAVDRDKVAKNELANKLQQVETKATAGSIIGSIITSPFRMVADFVDSRDVKK